MWKSSKKQLRSSTRLDVCEGKSYEWLVSVCVEWPLSRAELITTPPLPGLSSPLHGFIFPPFYFLTFALPSTILKTFPLPFLYLNPNHVSTTIHCPPLPPPLPPPPSPAISTCHYSSAHHFSFSSLPLQQLLSSSLPSLFFPPHLPNRLLWKTGECVNAGKLLKLPVESNCWATSVPLSSCQYTARYNSLGSSGKKSSYHHHFSFISGNRKTEVGARLMWYVLDRSVDVYFVLVTFVVDE